MRRWAAPAADDTRALPGLMLAGMIGQLGQPRFESSLLLGLHPVLPAASCSVYQTGSGHRPRLFMSASHGVRDTTRDCWRAYLSGPHLSDRTLAPEGATGLEATDSRQIAICHITAPEVPVEHRARVYDAHGVAERVSVVQRSGQCLLAVNFYRHQHQRAFSDAQLGDFELMAPALLALTQKHIALTSAPEEPDCPLEEWQQKLLRIEPALTPRELDVCARLLMGMTHDGIAADLGLGLPTIKTYRNRAFSRLKIHFRNQLFALMLKA